MEAFPLNTNTTNLPPTSSQEGLAGIQSESSEEFTPAMDQALASKENELTPLHSKTDSDVESSLLDGTASAFIADKVDNSAILGKTNTAITNSETTEIQTTTIATLFNATPEQDENHLTVPISGDNNLTAPPSKAESVLLQQIQQILDQSKDSGVIVIRGNELTQSSGINQTENLQNLSNPILAETDTGEIQAKHVGIPLMNVDEATVTTQKAVQLEGAHQEVSEQYLNAKIDQSTGNSNESSEKNNDEQKRTDQQNKPDIQQIATSQNTMVHDVKPVESSFGQQLSQVVTVTNDPASSIEGKFAPGANIPVPEKELVSNLIHRFNVNPRLQTSKLSMQLNPAELGSLKIDILVEGDSLKANIVAQSHQVLDLLEKNMPRLKTVLEEQGFKVDAFEISINTTGGEQKDFFQEQFNSQQQEFTSSKSSSGKNEPFEILMDSHENLENDDEDTSGVNLTV